MIILIYSGSHHSKLLFWNWFFFYWTVRIKQNYIIVILYKLNWESYSIFLSSEIIYRFVLFYYHKQKIKVTCKILWRFNRKLYTQISRVFKSLPINCTGIPIQLDLNSLCTWTNQILLPEWSVLSCLKCRERDRREHGRLSRTLVQSPGLDPDTPGQVCPPAAMCWPELYRHQCTWDGEVLWGNVQQHEL